MFFTEMIRENIFEIFAVSRHEDFIAFQTELVVDNEHDVRKARVSSTFQKLAKLTIFQHHNLVGITILSNL
jgi:hypothetical protein